MVWPCAAASSNRLLSATASGDPSSDSHWPQEVEITFARSSSMIAA